MIVKIVTISSLAVLALELLFVIVSVISKLKNRPQLITFLRGFKKGKCAIIYVTAIPLYCVGHIYSGHRFIDALFGSIDEIIGLVVLNYDTKNIEKLMKADDLYNFAIYFCFFLVTLNALMLTISLTHQHIWCGIQTFKATRIKKDKLFIFGNNPENVSIYLSDKKRNKVIIDDISDKGSADFYMKRISFISTRFPDVLIPKLFRLIRKFDKEYIVVINTGSDEKNIGLCREIIKNINSIPEKMKKRLFIKTRIYVFGDPRYEAIYEGIVADGSGCIHYVNKYKKIAMDFIDRYPLSKFLDEEQVDYETSLIKDDVDINVAFVGFGKTAQQLFLTSVANNQFLKKGASDPELKKVKYFIFDKERADNNKNLNHNYYRYRYECSALDPKEYLPLPTPPAEETYYVLDVNDHSFYNRIRSVVTRSTKDANFVVIAFGSDLENIDMAQKLIEKRREWDVDNLVIFVKVRRWSKEQTALEGEGCYFIGNEKDVVYNVDKIISDHIFNMAQMRNKIYSLEYDITQNPDISVDKEYVEKKYEDARRNWYITKTQTERESNLYCCLSLRSKLNLMGLDYCEKKDEDDTGLSREEYLKIYAGDDHPDDTKYSVTADGKPIVFYPLDFKPSRRRTMAIHEHHRWNSFMISKGMIPSSRQQITSEKTLDKEGRERYTNGKNYAVRRHGNLTTFEGLKEFRRILAVRDNTTEAEKDVIKYDYQLLDDAYWLLQSNGYKIIKNVKLR